MGNSNVKAFFLPRRGDVIWKIIIIIMIITKAIITLTIIMKFRVFRVTVARRVIQKNILQKFCEIYKETPVPNSLSR